MWTNQLRSTEEKNTDNSINVDSCGLSGISHLSKEPEPTPVNKSGSEPGGVQVFQFADARMDEGPPWEPCWSKSEHWKQLVILRDWSADWLMLD